MSDTKELKEGGALQVDALEKYNELFSKKAKQLLQNKVLQGDPEMNEGDVRKRSKTVFLSHVVRKEENMDKACEKLISIVNDLVERDYVYGFLAPLSKIRLYSDTLEVPHAVFIFPHLTKEGAEYIKSNKPDSLTEEGGIGPDV